MQSVLDAPTDILGDKLCEKRQFQKREAQAFVNFAQKRRFLKNRRECRVYHCEECESWHVTSQEDIRPWVDGLWQ